MLIDRELPGQELVHRQGVTAEGFPKGQQSAANCGDDLGLTANDPPFGAGRGQIRDRQRATVGPDDIFDPRAMGFCHGVLTNSEHSLGTKYACRLKICLSLTLQYEW